MARANFGEANALRALSYLELAVAVGYRGKETVDLPAERDWANLLLRAEHLAHETKLLVEAVELKTKQDEDAARAVAEVDAKPADDGTDAAAVEADSDGSISPEPHQQGDLYEPEEEELPW